MQSPQETQAQSENQSQQKEDSVAGAARKAKEKKNAASQRKVFTEDDLSRMKKDGISVVGGESKQSTENTSASGRKGSDEPNSEGYWRSKTQPILEKLADVDKQIAQLKDDIKKYGSGGIDISTGLKYNVAYVNDRNGQIQKLEKKQADLQKQLDDLQEEGRKAGAEPAWFH